ncbi:esterase-like activity of phytase family protein [Ferruginibacter sp. SUN106]|uniref:esterase-like activity of phytase family protein n=1 Tax=Ferruginibacter sp. SUN106 TaxID=2978348 RepID=UPI003D36A365
MFRSSVFLLCSSLLVLSCSNLKKIAVAPQAENISAVKLLGEYDIPYNLNYKNTTVGGLSGIDYDAKNNVYYMICDDRSDINPARFYKARIFITPNGIDSIQFVGVEHMLQPDNTVYPNKKTDRSHVPDPEAVRYNPVSKQLVWSSEGERIVREKDTVLENPSVILITTDGKFKNNFELPANLTMHATEKGPRQNGVLEGMSFANNYKTLFVNVEEPLYEDGPRADITDNNTYIRILKFDVATKKNTAQYAYKLEPIAYAPDPVTGFKINGVPDILNIGNNKFLVIERSFSTGRLACTIKVFITDLSVATNIKEVASLKESNSFVPATKKLLLNMDDLGIYIDNIEGVTFGPTLPNGHKTLIFIADNNFDTKEKAQLLLFEVTE